MYIYKLSSFALDFQKFRIFHIMPLSFLDDYFSDFMLEFSSWNLKSQTQEENRSNIPKMQSSLSTLLPISGFPKDFQKTNSQLVSPQSCMMIKSSISSNQYLLISRSCLVQSLFSLPRSILFLTISLLCQSFLHRFDFLLID